MPSRPPSQLRILYRDFLGRIIDPELLAAGGEVQTLAVQLAAMLAAFSAMANERLGAAIA